ncbi:26S protease regulatory subunit [Deinococcus sp. Leaf326]|uniref:ATP-binding protein n=1 Tax=Deinococcus sp. Leaf326 TaxID=1736338 RepID=UPI0006FEF399|nr:ATP-binding protein [Deinococcus sp. Leaf326]KQQ99367.1 hypothetical protein ASF71_13350 [Deinococcus sp. Leaf326]
MTDSVIGALRAALDASPDDAGLREHLARLLLDAGRGPEALALLRAGLAADPTQQRVLALAVRAADLAGDAAAATAYQTVLNALYLSEQRPPEQQAPAAAGSPPAGGRPAPEYWAGERHGMDFPPPHDEADRPHLTPFDTRWQALGGGVTLRDVVGMTDLKERLERSLLGPLRQPELAQAYGKRAGGGLLLYGPPGCGKTFLARAVAGELGAAFLEVTVADVLDMWLGNAERNVRALFASARRRAPCVVFFDEVDALGRGRQLTRHSSHSVTQTLLRELDGLGGREGVFVMAATNAPWDVDSALKRPGRLGATLLVPPPDLAAREAMFGEFMRGRPTRDLDSAWLARQTADYSGADIRHLCDDAAERALAQAMKRGTVQPVGMAEFRAALRDTRPSTREWLMQARNHVLHANEGGTYDELAELLRGKRLL